MSDLNAEKLVKEDPSSLMFDVESAEQAAEHLHARRCPCWASSVSPGALYYTLFYNYIAGKNVRLNKEVDELLKQHGCAGQGRRHRPFPAVFSVAGETLIEDIRKELVAMVAQVIGPWWTWRARPR